MKKIFLLSFLFFTGCVSQISDGFYSEKFNADYETVWSLVYDTLKDYEMQTLDKENGNIVTTWKEEFVSDKMQGFIFDNAWLRRKKAVVKLNSEENKTGISIKYLIQERAPIGAMAKNWQNVPSSGVLERQFLDYIQKRIQAIMYK